MFDVGERSECLVPSPPPATPHGQVDVDDDQIGRARHDQALLSRSYPDSIPIPKSMSTPFLFPLKGFRRFRTLEPTYKS